MCYNNSKLYRAQANCLSFLPFHYLDKVYVFSVLFDLFFPTSHHILIGFTVSQDSLLIDRWELTTCKHFMHTFAYHHSWDPRSQTSYTITDPLHIAFSVVFCIFTRQMHAVVSTEHSLRSF